MLRAFSKHIFLLCIPLFFTWAIYAQQTDTGEPITVDNAAILNEHLRIGRGVPTKVLASPDGETIAVQTAVGIWLYTLDAIDTTEDPPLLSPQATVATSNLDMAFSRDGSLLAVVEQNLATVWEVETHTIVFQFEEAWRDFSVVTFNPAGNMLLAVRSRDAIVTIPLKNTPEELTVAYDGFPNRIENLVFSPDGATLVVTGDTGSIHLLDGTTLERIRVVEAHGDRVAAITFNDDGTLLLTGSDDETARLWNISDPASGIEEIARTKFTPTSADVDAVAFNADENIATLGVSGAQGLIMWDIKADTQTQYEQYGNVLDLTYSLDGESLFIMAITDAIFTSILAVDPNTGIQTAQAIDHYSPLNAVAYSPDGNMLAFGLRQGHTFLWDTRTEPVLAEMPVFPDTLPFDADENKLAFTPDGTYLIAVDHSNLTIIDTATQEAQQIDFNARTFALSPDGSLLAASGYQQTSIFAVKSGVVLFNMPGYAQSIAFHPEQTAIALAMGDGTLRILSLDESGE